MFENDKKIQFVKDTLASRQNYHELLLNHSFTDSEKDILLQATVNIMHSSPDKFLIYEAYEILAAKSFKESTKDTTNQTTIIDSYKPENKLNENTIRTKKLLGIIGSIMLFIGVFLPIIHIPIMGDINYFRNGKGDGVIILIFSAISLFLVLSERFKMLWLTGLASIGVMLFTLYNFSSKISEAQTKMDADLSGNPFRGLADTAMQSFQLEWGWAILFVGVGFIFASAILSEKSK